MQRRHLTTALLAGALAPLAARAQTAPWPAKPIRVIVPYPPGGFTDVTARLICQKLQERLGQPVMVDNKPGANSIVGVDMLAKAPADGYTFAVVIAAYAANTTLYPKLPYDSKKDLAPVSLIGVSPLVAAVNNNAPFKTARELVAYAKAHPGKISYGSSGNGSAVHLSTELLKALTGSYMVHIPYKGAAPALNDLMGGQIDLFLDAASGHIAPGKAGKIRLIGVASEQRLPALPEVPTFIEQGVPDFEVNSWNGILVPMKTPRPVVDRLHREIAAVLRDPDTRERFAALGIEPVGNTPEQFTEQIKVDLARWAKVVEQAKIHVD